MGPPPHAPRNAMFEGNGPLWKLLGVGFVHEILVGWRSYLFSSVGCVGLRVPGVQDKNYGLKFECFPSFVAFLYWNLYFVLSLSAFPLEHVIGVSFPRYFEAAGAASPRHHYVHEGYSSSPGRAAGNELTTTHLGCWQENSLTPTRPGGWYTVRPYYQRITV